MSGKNIFTSPRDKQMESYNSKIAWACDSRSDPITALNLYEVSVYNDTDRSVMEIYT